MIISRIVENVTENDMRIFIKTRIESSKSENDCSLGSTRLSGSVIFGEQSDPLPEDVLRANEDKSFVSMFNQQSLLHYIDLIFSQVPEQISVAAILKWKELPHVSMTQIRNNHFVTQRFNV